MNKYLIVSGIIVGFAVLFFSQTKQMKSAKISPIATPPIPLQSNITEIKTVALKGRAIEKEVPGLQIDISSTLKIVIGEDFATKNRYLLRSEALRRLPENLTSVEVDVLLDYLASTNDVLRIERVAALKNDIMNILRRQINTPGKFSQTLIYMVESRIYEPVILDYCIQHLGAMLNSIENETELQTVRNCLKDATRIFSASYSGTALYSLADDNRASNEQKNFLREQTIGLAISQTANSNARISALLLSGEQKYFEILPSLRKFVKSERQNIPLKIVAIGTLGTLGEKSDIELLNALQKSADSRFDAAITSALEKLSIAP